MTQNLENQNITEEKHPYEAGSVIQASGNGRRRPWQSKTALLFIIIFALLGVGLIWRSFAATSTVASYEAETMTLWGKAGSKPVYADAASSTVKSSGGSYVKLFQNAALFKSTKLPSAINRVTIRAYGDQCDGAPLMTTFINTKAVSTVSVTATQYTDYTVAVNFPAGSTVQVGAWYKNDYTHDVGGKRLCDRNLNLDTVTLSYVADTTPKPVTPAPTKTVANPLLLAYNKQVLQGALSKYKYQNGQWLPSHYNQSDWSIYQVAATGAAALGSLPDGTAAQRQMAIDTVNLAIATHQLPNGDFDNGTPSSGTSAVNGGMWVAAEGLIALDLHKQVSPETLKAWEQSMVRYVNFLQTSGNSHYYANGNIVLRFSLIDLETYNLAKLVGDPNAMTYWNDYQAQKQFLVSPTNFTHTNPPIWVGYGQHTNGNSLYFSETNSSGATLPLPCANGKVPCNGFDPEYTMLQLNDALIAYMVGGDSPYWKTVIDGEYAAIKPYIANGTLNGANGSRHNNPNALFDAPVYGFYENRNEGNFDNAWKGQLDQYKGATDYAASLDAPSPGTYRWLMYLSGPLVDANDTLN